MDGIKAVRAMLARSGKSVRGVSSDMGKSPTYLSGIVTRGSVPKVDTMADIAAACGYDLVLVPQDKAGEVIRIDGVAAE